MTTKTEVNTQALGRAVACLRLERGMKRKDLVAVCAISYPFLAEIEDGRKSPSMVMLARIASALQVPPSAVLDFADSIVADPRNGLS